MNLVFLSLGSNMGDRIAVLKGAIAALNARDGLALHRVSSIYETEPVGYTDQAPFLNVVAAGRSSLDPLSLLDACQRVEKDFGRRRDVRWGPRTLDIDIVLISGVVMDTERLTLPHPRMHERAFVLVPLAQLGCAARVRGRTIGEWHDRVVDEEGQKVALYAETTDWLAD